MARSLCPRGGKVRKGRPCSMDSAWRRFSSRDYRSSPLLNPPPVGAEARQGGEEGGRGRAWRSGGGSSSPCPRGRTVRKRGLLHGLAVEPLFVPRLRGPPPQSSPGGGGGQAGAGERADGAALGEVEAGVAIPSHAGGRLGRGTDVPSRIAASTASVLESTSLSQNLRTRYPWRANQASRAASAEAPCCPPSTSITSDRAAQ